MPTTLFQLLPWNGGLNTSTDEAMIAAGDMSACNNLHKVENGYEKRDGINYDWDDAAAGTDTIVGEHDFWWGEGSKQQLKVAVAASGKVYSYDATGERTELTVSGTAWTGTLTSAILHTYGNKVFIAVDGLNNVMKYWAGSGNVEDVPGNPPKPSFLFEHQGRLMCDDKSKKDLLHYCQAFDYTKWNGEGDSGAIPIGDGDGDETGIAAGVSWKGDAFIFKRSHYYRIVGQSPETWQILLQSASLGALGPNAVCSVEQDDVIFVSEKGVHSLVATSNFGDYQGQYLSAPIQDTFVEDLSRARLKFISVRYLPSENMLALACTEESSLNRTLTTNVVNNTLLCYNVPQKKWWRWGDVPCTSLMVANDPDRQRLYFGTHTGRLAQAFANANYDTLPSGTRAAIKLSATLGYIYTDQSPYTLKAFKRFILFYRPKGRQNITVKVKVDGQPLTVENTLSFGQVSTGTPLGLGFSLGSTVLGGSGVFGPHVRTVDGIGRGIKVTIEQNDADAGAAILGFGIEYEASGTAFEEV